MVGDATLHGRVRFAIGSCCGCSDTQTIALDACNLVLACPRLHPYGRQHFAAAPLGDRFQLRVQIPIGFRPCTTIEAAKSMIIAKIGEISRPPIGGINRRKGRNTGSVSVAMMAVAGL